MSIMWGYEMREMCDRIFRGKDKETGEWVYGCLLADNVIVTSHQTFKVMDGKVCGDLRAHAVYFDTVGQFTGLRDKNDVPIYEGDIVMKRTYQGKKPLEVVFSHGCFHCGWGGGSSTPSHPYTLDDRNIEVIGNIYDTPELLEDKK